MIESISVRDDEVQVEPGGVGVGDDVEAFVEDLEAAALTLFVDGHPETLEMFGTMFVSAASGDRSAVSAPVDPETGLVVVVDVPFASFRE